ncbi:MAG: hypothetical protein Q9162_004005 [Coniocarpon cinnabarinum]
MEQQRALNSLEPYLILSKNARTASSAAELVSQATSDSQTFVFAELMQAPSIQALRDSEHASDMALLETFAWGTWKEYQSAPYLPTLNASQTQKLKQLSLVSLLGIPIQPNSLKITDTLSYSFLQQHLDLERQVDLEQLLTSTLSSGLITGHLDPLHKRVAVTSVAPLRDLAPGCAPRLTLMLSNWATQCDAALDDIEAQMRNVRSGARRRERLAKARKIAFDREAEADEADLEADRESGQKLRAKRKEPGGRGTEVMEVDDEAMKGGLRSGAAKAKRMLGKGLR